MMKGAAMSNHPAETRSAMVVFSDLDGTLLDSKTYTFEAAREALTELRARNIPLVLVSSKTRAEIEPIRLQLQNEHPFIIENGGGVVIPYGYFPFPLTEAIRRDAYQIVELGTTYPLLRRALKDIQEELGRKLKGYGDMSLEEIVALTGLSCEDASLSKQREYDEPFVTEGVEFPENRLIEAVKKHGLRYTRGDRFSHLMGPHDKGKAVRYLIDCYRRKTGLGNGTLMTIAIGNSLNDLAMLEAVDHPIIVQLADGSYDPAIAVPHISKAPGPGPSGWNIAVRALLR
ncbi:MAG TPA: HAD-IIB family hydrolase [Nitrospira sp.]|nr:HAD-IIB family hydrolase [Nitrospira sp.]